jgi:hypothetical protein
VNELKKYSFLRASFQASLIGSSSPYRLNRKIARATIEHRQPVDPIIFRALSPKKVAIVKKCTNATRL